MRTILAATAVVAMMSGAAIAQTTPSGADKPAPAGQQPAADPKHTSPGATGAMQNEVGGTATSPQDVQKQGGAVTAPAHDKDGTSKESTGGGEKSK